MLLQFELFHASYGTRSSNHFDEIVSKIVVNRDPHSQQDVQTEIKRDIEISGSGGKAPRKVFEDMHSALA